MSDYYGDVYGDTYGGVIFPSVPVPASAHLKIGGTWTDVTTYMLQRDNRSAVPAISRGRPDETSTASPQTMNGQLNNRDGRFSPRNPLGLYYGSLPFRNVPIRYGVTGAGSYLRFADDSTSYASCPDSAGLQITGDIDIRILVKLDDHRACQLASKWQSFSGGWVLLLNGDGTLGFYWQGGSVVTSTAGLAVPLGTVLIRVTLAVATGTVTFYTGTAMGAGTQLGSPVVTGSTSVAAAAGQAVAVGYSASVAALSAYSAYSGCLGAVYEFQLRNGIGATVVADPVFSSQAPGVTSFTDVQNNLWSVAGTAEISGTLWRFHGEIAGLPQAWDVTGTDIWSPFAAAGMMRRLLQQQRPAFSSMRRAIMNVAPVQAYWPCEDGAGATQLAAAIGTQPMAIQGTPALASDSSFSCSAPLPQPQGAAFSVAVPPYAAGNVQTVLLLVTLSSADSAGSADILTFSTAGTAQQVIVQAISGGFNVQAIGGGSSLATVNTADTYANQPVMVQVTLNCSLIPAQLQLNVTTPTGGGEGVTATFSGSSGAVTSVTTAAVNNVVLTTSAIGHIAVINGPAVSSLDGALAAHSGETAATRFARLCAENNLGCRIYGYPALSSAMGPQGVATLATLLQECETADQGLIFESRRALALGYRTLKSLTNQSAALTLDYSQAYIGNGSGVLMQPTDDDAHTVNDVTATRGSAGGSSGASFTATLDDGSFMSTSAPPSGAGDYQSTPSVNVQADAQLGSWANWRLHTGTNPESRFPQVPLQLARSELTALLYTIAGLDIGDRIDITNLPAWLGGGSTRQLMFGYTEQPGGFLWDWSPNLVPESSYETGVIGAGSTGHIQTDGSTLASGCTSGATSLSVASSGRLWTTAAGDVPFDIIVGPVAGQGEQMTVTVISGSSSPQTFTVTRSVNGVVMAHNSGEQVRVAYPLVLAVA